MHITRNAFATTLQVIGSSLILFFLYRMVVERLGADALGIWSIVLATASASRIGELGLSASVTRFVAKHRANDLQLAAGESIQTAAISIAAFLFIALIIAYPALTYLFGYLFEDRAYIDAISLLPYALVSLLLTALAAVFQSGLDGYQRYDLRSLLVLSSQSAALLLAFVLTPRFGLYGLAWAQVLQSVFLLVAGWILLRHIIPTLPMAPVQWRKARFLEMLSYGLQFQLGAIAMMLFDPLTKSLLGKYGGLASAGYFEMARQFVAKARQLIVSANQVLVPVAAELNESQPRALENLYRTNLQMLAITVFPLFSLVVAWAPLVSELWIDRYEPQFIFFVGILAIGWGLNVFSGPAYFANVGTGNLAWNTASHIWMGLANLVLATFLGLHFGAVGVAWATMVSLATGSAIVAYGFHRKRNINWRSIFSAATMGLALAAVTVGITVNYIYIALDSEATLLRLTISLIIPAVIYIPLLWVHPQRAVFQSWLYANRTQAGQRPVD